MSPSIHPQVLRHRSGDRRGGEARWRTPSSSPLGARAAEPSMPPPPSRSSHSACGPPTPNPYQRATPRGASSPASSPQPYLPVLLPLAFAPPRPVCSSQLLLRPCICLLLADLVLPPRISPARPPCVMALAGLEAG